MLSIIVLGIVLVSAAAARVIPEHRNNFNEYSNSRNPRFQHLEQSPNLGWPQLSDHNQNYHQESPAEELRDIQFEHQNQYQESPFSHEERYLSQNNHPQVSIIQEEPRVLHYEPQNHLIKPLEPKEHYPPAKYQFRYFVHDEKTGDIKSQEEARNGDEVKGSYSLVQPDGLKRVVEYYDASHGFNAHVRYEPLH